MDSINPKGLWVAQNINMLKSIPYLVENYKSIVVVISLKFVLCILIYNT